MAEKKIRNMKLSDYEMGDTIGMCQFGRIKFAKNKKTEEFAAIKILKKKKIIESKQEEHAINEINILEMIDHPFIVHFIGLYQDEKYIYIATELVNGGELFTCLRAAETFPIDQARFYLAQVINCFEYLHSKKIIYRALKTENILIQKNGYIKLSGFSCAKVVEGRTYTLCGTPDYLAPEIILNKGHGKPVDWWACGVLLYELLTGVTPFGDEDTVKIYQNILECKLKFPSDFDHDAKSLIKHLLQPDLSKRFGNLRNGVKDITDHAFFKPFDWDKLIQEQIPAPYIPKNVEKGDTSNFCFYPDSDSELEPVGKDNDPFSKLSG